MNDERMGTKKILPLLVEFSVPAIIGMLVNAIYNVVDRMFIGNAPDLGAIGIAGITISYPITLVLMAISLMVGVGGATRFSISLGKKEPEKARIYQGNAVVLTIIFGLIFTIFGNVFIDPILRILGASDKVMSHARDYLSIVLYGAVFQCVAMCGNNFSRAQGNPKNAMISQLIGAGFNILFDYILIMKLHMGMHGAAIATIGGQFLSMIWQLCYLCSNRSLIKLDLDCLKLKVNYVLDIIKTGIPAFLMQMANSVLNFILNSTLGRYGSDIAISAVGIITSFQTICQMPLTGLMQGQQPLVSYNYGAAKYDRVKETLKYAVIGGTIIAVTGFLAVEIFPETIIKMFNSEKDIVELGVKAIRIWFACLPLLGAQIIMANYFQCIGKIKVASVLNLLRQVIILIPMILLLAAVIGLDGIFMAVPIADLSAFVITICLFVKAIKKLF
ncbi:MATE family efflux transporter [Thomasclavelia saccharogumia]|uniref:MATE family efflux transporter n=1 Tax=Thomasclavelia saccharogumia TaxID=341225 RepID=UPI000478714F|nr:MATE family efflux transporter [Thomasclavelia saccharogumia]